MKSVWQMLHVKRDLEFSFVWGIISMNISEPNQKNEEMAQYSRDFILLRKYGKYMETKS